MAILSGDQGQLDAIGGNRWQSMAISRHQGQLASSASRSAFLIWTSAWSFCWRACGEKGAEGGRCAVVSAPSLFLTCARAASSASVLECLFFVRHLQSDALRCTQDAIRCTQMHSDALRCTQMHSRCTQMHSRCTQDALRCTQMHSDALSMHSDALRCTQMHSDALRCTQYALRRVPSLWPSPRPPN